ncbi:MAG: HAD-IC family P-type ATPase [Gammaproteobacteria bacterium]
MTASLLDSPQVVPVHTAVPGRIRLKVASLYHADAAFKLRLEARLGALEGIESVGASTLTGSLLLRYDAGQTPEDILALVEHEVEESNAVVSLGARAAVPFTEYIPIGGVEAVRVTADIQAGEIPPQFRWHGLDRDTVLDKLHTPLATGLVSEEAHARLARLGRNILPQASPRSALGMLVDQFKSLPVALLGVAAGVSVMTGGLVDAVAILGVVMLNAAIGYMTERQSENTIRALTRAQFAAASVLRDQVPCQIPVEKVVMGDVFQFTPGQYVAADARLIKTKRLTLDESQLTGESTPVSKSAKLVLDARVPLAERKNMAYRGTRVTGGSGVGVAVATGPYTEIGKIHQLASEARTPDTPMQIQLERMGVQLVVFSSLACGAMFLIGLMRGYGALQMFKSAISLAVAALPEGLPAVATTTLALGIREMRRHGVLIRRLDAVEALGAMEVLCLDKTGTLTLNRMSATAIHLNSERIEIDERRFMVSGATIDPTRRPELMRLMRLLALCNEASIKAGDEGPQIDGSGTEAALLELTLKAGIDPIALRRAHPLAKTRYRSTGRLYMRTTHELAGGQQLVAVKGSPAQVLSMCRWRLDQGAVAELSDADRAGIKAENERMAGEALRVLGVAYAEGERKPHKEGLIWVGQVGISDPLRPGIRSLMRAFRGAGIEAVMITGDQSATALAVGRQIGLNGAGSLELIDFSRLEALDLDSLVGAKNRAHIFSRVDPAQKLQIVQAFQRAGRVVAMSGDGVNDGPALKAADIGIAIGGAEAARSVADVVLEGDRLDAMLTAVRQGRTIYGNIRKSIHFLLATNLSEIEVCLAAVLLGLGQPLTPMQLLWINLITDVFPALALAMEPPEADVLQSPPRDPEQPILRRRDFSRLSRESTIITAGTLGSYAYGMMRYGVGPRASTQAFLTLVLGQLLHAYSCRSERTSLFDPAGRPPNRYLDAAVGGSMALQLLAAVTPGLRGLLGSAPIGLIDGLVAVTGAALPLLVNERNKEQACMAGGQIRADCDDVHARQRGLGDGA